MEIKIKYLKDVKKIEKISIGDWIDLRVAEDVWIAKGDTCFIPLGVAMQLPKDYEAHIIPRSSTFFKYDIILGNSYGLIDESYCGDNDEWMFPAIALEDTSIPKNTRICQFRIVKKMPTIKFVEVDKLNNIDRGGFGQTGRE